MSLLWIILRTKTPQNRIAIQEQRDLRVSIFLESSSLLTEHTVENIGILSATTTA